MAEISAGILMYRRCTNEVEVLLVRPGGPFWRTRRAGAWMIPKGMIEAGEDPETAARREFEEELGSAASGDLVPLGRIRQAGGKIVEAFAMEGDLDASAITSITFELEWPRGSGRIGSFPEVEEAGWFALSDARTVMLPSQLPLIDRLAETLQLVGDQAPGCG